MSAEARRTLRIVCIDDNPLVAKAFLRRLEHETSLTCVETACDGNRAYEVIRQAVPDVVLMDVDMPGVDTFGIVEKIATDMPQVRVIMISGHVNTEFIDRALDVGAWGYLSKNEEVADLIDAIHRASRGEIVLGKEARTVHRTATPRR